MDCYLIAWADKLPTLLLLKPGRVGCVLRTKPTFIWCVERTLLDYSTSASRG